MTATHKAVPAEDMEEKAEPGLGDLFERVIGDLRGVAYAEFDLFQTTYWLKLRGVLWSLAIIVAGVIMCLAALAALLMGLVLGFAAMIGPFPAAFAVGGGALAAGALVLLLAVRKLNRQMATISQDRASDNEPMLDGANDR